MLDVLVRNRIGIDIVILRRNVVARIVSRHGCVDISKRRKDGNDTDG